MIVLISLTLNISGNCQSDTLTKNQTDSLFSWIGAINTDLIDYDLVKQKSSLQGEQIRGLEAIKQKQNLLSQRKESKLDLFSLQIISLQSKVITLQSNLTSTKRKAVRRGVINFALGFSTVFLTGKILNFY